MTDSDNCKIKGTIYKLIDNTNGMFYFGSTIGPLHKRYHGHKTNSKKQNVLQTTHRKVYEYFTPAKFETKEVVIIELQVVAVSTRNELRKIENDFFQSELNNPLCINTYCATYTPEIAKSRLAGYEEKRKNDPHRKLYRQQYSTKYYEKNKERLPNESKKYYQENRVEILKRVHENYYAK